MNNEICANCGRIKKSQHHTLDRRLICYRMTNDRRFESSGRVSVPVEFAEAVRSLVGPYWRPKSYTLLDMVKLLDEKMQKVAAMLDQIEKEGGRPADEDV